MPTQEQLHKHYFKHSWVCMYAEDTVQDKISIDQAHLQPSDVHDSYCYLLDMDGNLILLVPSQISLNNSTYTFYYM